MEVETITSQKTALLKKTLKAFGFKSDTDTVSFTDNSGNYFLVAVENNQPIGYLLAYKLERPETRKPKFFVYDIEVLKSKRRQGVGSALVEGIKEIAKKNNALEVFIPTNKSNLPATKLYSKTGGIAENEDDIFYIYNL